MEKKEIYKNELNTDLIIISLTIKIIIKDIRSDC